MPLFKIETTEKKYSNAMFVIAKDYNDASIKAGEYLKHIAKTKSIFEYDRDGASSIRRDLYENKEEKITQIEFLTDEIIQ